MLLVLAGCLALVGLALSFLLGSTPRTIHMRAGSGPEMVQIALPMANVFLIKAARPILIDAGGPGDEGAILEALAREGIDRRGLGLIVLTHAHADHAGSAAALQVATGAPVALGAEDADMAAAGRNGELKPVGFEARLLLPFVNPPFAPFKPDLAIERELDLAPWGVAGKVVALPAHTSGSVAVLLDNGEAFVGDLMRGGSLGGMINPGSPADHYFQPDIGLARRLICALVNRGVMRFHVGHGGPLSRDSVVQTFACEPAARAPV